MSVDERDTNGEERVEMDKPNVRGFTPEVAHHRPAALHIVSGGRELCIRRENQDRPFNTIFLIYLPYWLGICGIAERQQ
jgi:hypothetical protein